MSPKAEDFFKKYRKFLVGDYVEIINPNHDSRMGEKWELTSIGIDGDLLYKHGIYVVTFNLGGDSTDDGFPKSEHSVMLYKRPPRNWIKYLVKRIRHGRLPFTGRNV